jgi:hypothetical protein
MKNVAATSGQSVNLATAFLVEGNTWEGTCAGSDTVLNFFLSSSYKRSSLSLYAKQAHVLKNTRSARARKKKMHEIKKNFWARQLYFWTAASPFFAAGEAALGLTACGTICWHRRVGASFKLRHECLAINPGFSP